MALLDAINEVMAVANSPRKQLPPGAKILAGEQLLEHIEKNKIHGAIRQRDTLTESQRQVAKVAWLICGKILTGQKDSLFSSEEAFIDGFCSDRNPDHEIALWLLFSLCFAKFMHEYPSENRENVVTSLIRLSTNIPPVGLPGKRARELAKIWGRYVKNGVDRTDWEWLLAQIK